MSDKMASKPSKTRFHEQLSNFDLELPSSKLDYNRRLFRVVALRYDLVTRLLSFGQDQRWKRALLRELPEGGAPEVLDIACGTGDIAAALAQRYPRGRITGVDLDSEMLARAQKRLRGADFASVTLLEGDMSALPFPDSSFDVATGGYALRNAPDLPTTLHEIHRVMRPGARAAFLDFSKSRSPSAARATLMLLSFWGRLWGSVLHRNPEVYGYIAESLRHFPDRAQLAHMLHECGFRSVRTRPLLGGMLAIIRFRRPL